MTGRQKMLRIVYPLIMWFNKLTGQRTSVIKNHHVMQPQESFYHLSATLNNGEMLSFEKLKGQKVLLVNTASNCGYTGQYQELQQMHEKFGDKLRIIGFPANDFMEQEKGSDEEIAAFCQLNYGVSFPLARKSSVIGDDKNDVYRWLSDKNRNGWNEQEPTWNFAKYLVNEDGVLLRYFDPGVSPLSEEIVNLINE